MITKALKKNITQFNPRRYILLLCGSAILAFGLYNVHSRSLITEGGVLGMTLLLNHWFGISPAIAGPIMDITCYIIGFRMLGKAFLKYALVASSGFAIFYALFENIGPVIPNLSGTPLLAAVIGGLFVGTGVGLIVRCGGASGGDDALALIIAKITHCKIAKAYLATDLAVLLLSLSYVPFQKIAYSLITVTLSSFIIGKIHQSTPQEA